MSVVSRLKQVIVMSKNIIFPFVLLAVVFSTNGLKHKHIVENKFANIVLKSSAFIEDSPQRSLQCFAIYVPLLNNLTATFEYDYEKCLQSSANARTAIDFEVQSDRDGLENSALEVCGAFQNCSNSAKNSYDFFECYSFVAGETTRTAFNIQNVANTQMEIIKLRYTTITFDENRCTDECSRVYIEESANLYSELDECLAGSSVSPNQPISTTPSTTYRPTTHVPAPPNNLH